MFLLSNIRMCNQTKTVFSFRQTPTRVIKIHNVENEIGIRMKYVTKIQNKRDLARIVTARKSDIVTWNENPAVCAKSVKVVKMNL